jgi:hypothetical protein
MTAIDNTVDQHELTGIIELLVRQNPGIEEGDLLRRAERVAAEVHGWRIGAALDALWRQGQIEITCPADGEPSFRLSTP